MAVRVRHALKPLALLLLGGALAFPGVGSSRTAAIPTLYVAYTIRCTFAITDDAGKPVTSIPPGGYQVQVTTPGSFGGVDLSGVTDLTACKGSIEFRLTGPGVNLSTSLGDGDGSYDLLSATFQPNSTYTAVDLVNPTATRLNITTTAAGTGTTSTTSTTTTGTTTTGTTTSTTPTNTKVVGTLAGTVSSSGALSLKLKGKAVTTLAPGAYKLTVVDKSTTSGFFVQQAKGATTTVSGVSAVGSQTVTITLKAGQWFYFATPKGKKSGFLVAAPGLYG